MRADVGGGPHLSLLAPQPAMHTPSSFFVESAYPAAQLLPHSSTVKWTDPVHNRAVMYGDPTLSTQLLSEVGNRHTRRLMIPETTETPRGYRNEGVS
jgi:hypothetical protein